MNQVDEPREVREVEDAVRGALGGRVRSVSGVARVSGGSSRQIWAVDVTTANGELHLILRRDSPLEIRPGAARAEADVMAAARDAGVPVPEVIAVVEPTDGSAPGLIMTRVEGASLPRRVLREPALEPARGRLARQCGQALGRLHTAPTPAGLQRVDRLTEYRDQLDRLGAGRPVLELAHRWLVEHRPPAQPDGVVHGDFRLGNLVVGPEGLRAVLDWESAHTGDRLEDLGWLCVPAWRFRGRLPVGGFGTVEDLLDGYREASGRTVEADHLTWAIVLGTWVWAVGCLAQADRHRSGAQRSVDLAAVGRRVVENEADLLQLLAPLVGAGPLAIVPTAGAATGSGPSTGGLPYGPPSLEELLDAVRELLEETIVPGADDRQRYQLQVCVSILDMAGREVRRSTATPDLDDGLALAEAIRTGRCPDEAAAVHTLAQRTADLLAVTNPRYGARQ